MLRLNLNGWLRHLLLTISLNFVMLAVIIFFMVKEINKLKQLHEPPPAPKTDPVVPEDVTLLREIRDVLKDVRAGQAH